MENKDYSQPVMADSLASMMAEATISVSNNYTQSLEVLKIGDSVIGTLGNFSASIGKAKSKKTFNVSAIVASALTRFVLEGYSG